MIDQSVFKTTWALLCERFNRQHSDPLMLAYYKTLSEQMSTDQFRAASQMIFEEREFFPRPADFLERARPSIEAECMSQWEAVQGWISGGSAVGVNEESQRVVRMLGGRHQLGMTNVDSLPFVRKEFFQLYGDAATVARRESGERIAPTAESLQITAALMRGPDAR